MDKTDQVIKEKKQATLDRITSRIRLNVLEYYEQFQRPIKASDIIKQHRGIVSSSPFTWHEIEAEMKGKKMLKTRLSETNLKWYFPFLEEFTEPVMDELVALLEPVRAPKR